MAAEIERKFLPEAPPEGLDEAPATRIEQGYLAITEEVEVRLRRRGERLTLTVKAGAGRVRAEEEIPVAREQFDALWPLTASRRVVKTRHVVALGDGLEAEVDVYHDALDGLLTAEVEFTSEDASDAFAPPDWLGAEITGDGRYANQALAVRGRP